MSDLQILTIALSVIIPLSMLIHSNSRISDTKDALNKRMDSLESNLNQRMDSLETNLKEHIDNAFQHMELLLKIHEAEHHSKGEK